MILHQFLYWSRNEGTDLYSVCFEDRTYDMPEGIDKRSKFIMIMKDALVQMSINIRK